MPFRHPSRRPALRRAAGRAVRLAAGLGLGLIPGLAPARAQAVPETIVAWHCYRNGAATVLATEKTDSVGSKLLVRKPTADLKTDCAVEQRPSDRVLGVDDTTDEGSYTYIALAKAFLILDNGTGPDRGLVIYAIPAGRKRLAVGYSVAGSCDPTSGCQSDDFRIDDTGLTFWRQIDEKPTPKNCRGYAGFMKTTGSAALEERSVFRFASGTVEGSGTKRCTARQ
ncbi:hypothetical protein [Methylobacterium sp. GC_Met_2]|uniref:hypothetical protein n=1 Tax=Methylobacterium sp. GC_Met_2 TaxID=2937376 RepID=UPI00226BADCF|nr:hypothetical protein [Methylobacterium sp. GC_Met_2]